MAKIDYVQLEPKAFLADLIAMTTVESGAYARLVLYLYNNKGQCKNDPNVIKQICGNPRNFDSIWNNIKHKFQVNGASIVQKRVTQELQEAERRVALKTERAKKASAARWGKNGDFEDLEDSSSTAQALHTDSVSNANGNGNINGNNNTPPISPPKSGVFFNFETAQFEGIGNDKKTQWAVAFPAVDIDLELKRAALWASDNPAKRKSNWGRFLTNWLKRTQERGGNRNGGRSSNNRTNFNQQKSQIGETVEA